ncbi:MAG: hypothetical protein LBE91_16495 [Tannerella sp.]|jgi:hypothetical protein|nr:hypothetical protein [Tannerella sp.]
MASYHIRVNEKMALGKSLVAYLQSIPQIVTFEMPEEKPASKSELYDGLDSAFAEVRLMLDGKKKEKSLDEFLEELRNERANELQNSIRKNRTA